MTSLTAKTLIAALALGSCLALTSRATTITIVGANRTASLTSAIAGTSGSGNPSEADIAAEFGLGTWELEGNVAGANGTNESLTVTVLTGAWGGQSVTGTWAIAPAFWTIYGNAVIALHAGNGGGDPDHFSFLVEPGELSGTWTYQVNSGTGGGFSNLRLFGNGEPEVQTNVPDDGSTLILLGLGVACIGFLRRRIG